MPAQFRWLLAGLAVILLLTQLSAGALLGQTHQVKSVSSDGLNRMTAVLFSLQFDTDLAVSGVPLADLPQNQTTDEGVWLDMFGVYSPLAASSAALLGIPSLVCDGEAFASDPQVFTGNVTTVLFNETSLIPVASIADPILGFFNSLSVPGAANFFLELPVAADVFSAMLILQDTRECDPWYGCTRDSGLQRRLADTNFSTCRLSLNVASYTGAYLHAVGDPNTPIVETDVTDFAERQLGACNLTELDPATDAFQSAASAISGTSYEALQASFWRAIMYGIADPIIACQRLLDVFINETVTHGSADTVLCLEDDESFANSSDPCCNFELRYGEGCCAERPQPFSFPAAVLDEDTQKLFHESGCSHRKILRGAIRDYLQSLNDNLNPTTGCASSAQQIASPDIFNAYFDFVGTCFDLCDLATPACQTNDDCPYSNLCFSLQCQSADQSGYGGIAYTECFADYMHPTIAAVTKVALGVPGATRDEFVTAMQDQLWDPYCNSYFYNSYLPLWFVKLDSSAPFGRIFSTDITEEECLNWESYCSFEYDYDEATCLSIGSGRSGLCTQRIGEINFLETTFAQCTFPSFSDQTTCQSHGGTWDLSGWDPCQLPLYTTEAACLDPSICPLPKTAADDDWSKTYCSNSFCYRSDLAKADCQYTCANPLQWQDTIDGTGICVDLACGSNSSYWPGRSFYVEEYGTEAECNAGICGGGGFIFFGTDGNNCTAQGSICSQRCSMCSAESEGNYLCLQEDAADSCTCAQVGGVWSNTYSVCQQLVSRSVCTANNWTLWQCSNISSLENCTSCTSQFCKMLGCYWNYDAPCRTEEQCVTYGGQCDDKAYIVNADGDCDINNPQRPENCVEGCLYPPVLDVSTDSIFCTEGVATDIGCIAELAGMTAADCTSAGGQVIHTAIGQQQCFGNYPSGCVEDEFAPFFTGKNETQCDTCSGSWDPAFGWTPGVWTPYAQLPLVWVPIEYRPSLWWQPMMNYTKLEDTVSIAAVTRTRLSLQSEAQCLINPLHSLLKLIACECTDVPPADEEICGGGKVRTVEIGSTLICAGSGGEIRLGSFVLSFDEDTVPSTTGCVKVDVTSLPAIQFSTPQPIALSSLSLAAAGSHRVDNDYAFIENQFGRQIGQIVSNVASISVTPLESSAAKRKSFANNASTVLSHLTVCFDHLDLIALDTSAFPVLDLSWYDGSKFHPLDLQNFSVRTSLDSRIVYCTTANFTNGTYSPIMRVSDYHSPEQVYSSVELAFIYIVAVLFLVAFVVTLILALLTLYVHGVKGFCMNLFKGKQLAVMILTLLLFFTGIRGIWLILSATQTISATSSLALDAVLTDLPIYIFFTLFMLLIFFWADLYHFQFKRKNSVLGRLKIPFLLVNLFIYVFFFIIIIVFSQSNANQQPTVDLVYKCIVAGIGFSILISFACYGGLLMIKSHRSNKATGGANSEQFIRMTVITMTCSVASFVQFIFLLLFAFANISSVVAILIYLFIVEIIPAYLLIYIFFHPKRLNETLTTSYGSHSGKVRSLPGSKRSASQDSRGNRSLGATTAGLAVASAST